MLWVCVNETTVALIDLHELLNKSLDCRLWRSSAVGDDADTPGADVSLLVGDSELATAAVLLVNCIYKRDKENVLKAPAACNHVLRLYCRFLRTSAELNSRGGQNASLDLGGTVKC